MSASNFIFVGIPNSGKSTMIKKLIENVPNLHVFSTDDEIEILAAKEGKTYSDLIETHFGIARKNANVKLAEAIKANKSIVFDQTNLTDRKRKKTLGDDIGRTHCICLLPPKDQTEFNTILTRNTNRTGKVIPVGIIVNMMKSYELPVKSDGFKEVTYFTINGQQLTESQAKHHFVDFTRYINKAV